MSKVIAPFLIKETIEDANFVITADGENYAGRRGRTREQPEISKTILFSTEYAIRDRNLHYTPQL